MKYTDYSNHVGLKFCHLLAKINFLPIRGTAKITLFLRKLIPKPKAEGLCVVKTIHGLKMLVDPIQDKGVERSLFENGTYEEGTLSVIGNILNHDDTFIDIGSNIGLMSLFAAKTLGGSGKVFSFEPLKNTYNILIQNVKLGNFENVEPVNIAIGSRNEIIDIFQNLAINRGASSLIKPDHTELFHSVSVYCLDNYIKENKIKYIKCIKIDVEGWELEVLKGAIETLSASNAPILIIECSVSHPMKGGGVEDLYNFITNINSYRIFKLKNGKERPSKLTEIKDVSFLPKHDNLFCFLPGHIEQLKGKIF